MDYLLGLLFFWLLKIAGYPRLYNKYIATPLTDKEMSTWYGPY